VKAIWKGKTLATSDATVVVEGNHYFPDSALVREHFRPSEKRSVCGWKGEAHYYDVVVGDEVNGDAAWFYPQPKEAAAKIQNYVAFWRGVEISE